MTDHEQTGRESMHHLMEEIQAPLVPEELASTHHSGELHGKALTEQAAIAELQLEAEPLQQQLDEIAIKIADANVRKSAYLEAFEIARALEDGK